MQAFRQDSGCRSLHRRSDGNARGFSQLPQPGWPNLKVVVTSAFARMYRNTGRSDFVERMTKFGISAARLAETPSKWVVMTRPSLMKDFEKKEIGRAHV